MNKGWKSYLSLFYINVACLSFDSEIADSVLLAISTFVKNSKKVMCCEKNRPIILLPTIMRETKLQNPLHKGWTKLQLTSHKRCPSQHFRITPTMLVLLLFSLLLVAVSASPPITDPTKFPGLENSTACISANAIYDLPPLVDCAADEWSCVCNNSTYSEQFARSIESRCSGFFDFFGLAALTVNATHAFIQFCEQLNGTASPSTPGTSPCHSRTKVSHNFYVE